MVKNLLYSILFLFTSFAFAQTNDNGALVNKKQEEKTITNLSASPNPLNIKSVISFDSTREQTVYFEVKNVLGKSVLKQKLVTAFGKNELNFSKDNLPAGMYIYSIQTDFEIVSKRMIIK
jgi:hypothetical protein